MQGYRAYVQNGEPCTLPSLPQEVPMSSKRRRKKKGRRKHAANHGKRPQC